MRLNFLVMLTLLGMLLPQTTEAQTRRATRGRATTDVTTTEPVASRRQLARQAREAKKAKAKEPQVTLVRHVANDGFVWFKAECSGKYGALDEQGNTIVPIEFSRVDYESNSLFQNHYFWVNKHGLVGVYTRKGRCIIPCEKYNFVNPRIAKQIGCLAWQVGISAKKNTYGLLDAYGREIIAPFKQSENGFTFVDGNSAPYFLYQNENYDFGVYNLNGINIHTPSSKIKFEGPNKDNTGYIIQSTEPPYTITTIAGSFPTLDNCTFNYKSFDDLVYSYEDVTPSKSTNSSAQQQSFTEALTDPKYAAIRRKWQAAYDELHQQNQNSSSAQQSTSEASVWNDGGFDQYGNYDYSKDKYKRWPNGIKPDVYGVSERGITTVNGVERPDLMIPLGTDSNSDSSSSSSTANKSNSNGFSKSQINRQADREAKAYEDFKKDPSGTSGAYYHSQKKMTKVMQNNANGK